MLKERGWVDDAGLQEMHERSRHEIDEAIEFAEQSDPNRRRRLYQDITVAPYIPQE